MWVEDKDWDDYMTAATSFGFKQDPYRGTNSTHDESEIVSQSSPKFESRAAAEAEAEAAALAAVAAAEIEAAEFATRHAHLYMILRTIHNTLVTARETKDVTVTPQSIQSWVACEINRCFKAFEETMNHEAPQCLVCHLVACRMATCNWCKFRWAKSTLLLLEDLFAALSGEYRGFVCRLESCGFAMFAYGIHLLSILNKGTLSKGPLKLVRPSCIKIYFGTPLWLRPFKTELSWFPRHLAYLSLSLDTLSVHGLVLDALTDYFQTHFLKTFELSSKDPLVPRIRTAQQSVAQQSVARKQKFEKIVARKRKFKNNNSWSNLLRLVNVRVETFKCPSLTIFDHNHLPALPALFDHGYLDEPERLMSIEIGVLDSSLFGHGHFSQWLSRGDRRVSFDIVLDEDLRKVVKSRDLYGLEFGTMHLEPETSKCLGASTSLRHFVCHGLDEDTLRVLISNGLFSRLTSLTIGLVSTENMIRIADEIVSTKRLQTLCVSVSCIRPRVTTFLKRMFCKGGHVMHHFIALSGTQVPWMETILDLPENMPVPVTQISWDSKHEPHKSITVRYQERLTKTLRSRRAWVNLCFFIAFVRANRGHRYCNSGLSILREPLFRMHLNNLE